jgi:glyoxylase-like metal-dependent hydrolase (beta-lactamase superfamily II)
MLVDTGLPASRAEFLDALWSEVEPADLRWVYLTHPDRDHTGSLMEVLEAAPQARVVTTFLGLGILGIDFPITPDRVYLLNPGQTLDLGDRQVECFRPPVFDSPATTGFLDRSTGTMFSSDCFGAPMPTPQAVEVEDIKDLVSDELEAAQRLWTTVDSPWVLGVDRSAFRGSLEAMRAMDPALLLSTHLPAARNAMPALLDTLATAPDADPFVGPDQAALEALLASFEPQPA